VARTDFVGSEIGAIGWESATPRRQKGNGVVETEDLRTFVEVADAGGVSAAARRLGVSKSIVSRRLTRLEANLGVQLLARNSHGVFLTEAGTTFRDHAARVTAEIDIARETVSPGGELRGRMRVALPLTFGPTHFAPMIAEMARRHPLLHVHASYGDPFVDLIAEGYDCAVRVGYLPDSNLVARRVGPIHANFVASPDYIRIHGAPETPDEFAGHQALMQGTEIWQYMQGDEIRTFRPQGRFKADNGVALAAAAAAGLGIAWLPDCTTYEYVASGRLVRVMTRHPPPPAATYVVRPPGPHPARKVRVLTDLLIEHIAGSPELWGADAVPRRGA
jgi:DNA-binding transcriptional LysR family regulator